MRIIHNCLLFFVLIGNLKHIVLGCKVYNFEFILIVKQSVKIKY
ncbi:hypothetical protein HERIO_2766 [Hepatospora eriocheir]|uniref:Uncharacterized protein n=1 Tax=Hepatospora eriocheir TaxID=1081669 RepID=A0A1X0QAA3_9MICR|nr:hypothetical protein HERIO_2766 [Hepatospora eriocheir]